jgi:small subunit ribosomal protein S8
MDTIGNLLTIIRNAEAAQHSEVTIPFSKQSLAVLTILKENGYVGPISEKGDIKKQLVVALVPKHLAYL